MRAAAVSAAAHVADVGVPKVITPLMCGGERGPQRQDPGEDDLDLLAPRLASPPAARREQASCQRGGPENPEGFSGEPGRGCVSGVSLADRK